MRSLRLKKEEDTKARKEVHKHGCRIWEEGIIRGLLGQCRLAGLLRKSSMVEYNGTQFAEILPNKG